ncbi:MAG: glycosyltransferase family 4 protein [SAR324 cluster bacterium]|nr:glycosyltransferase family 4 protein [SAR324 cluster bacterium]
MRVCLLAYRGNPYVGGQGVYLYELTRALVALGHQVEVMVGPPYPRDLSRWAIVHKVANLNLWGRYRRAWLPCEAPLRLLQPANLLDFALTRARFFPEPLSFSLRALGLLGRRLRTQRFDVLHDVQTLGYGMLGMMAFGIPLLTTVHHPLNIDRRAALHRNRTFEEVYHSVVFYPVGMQGVVIRRVARVITNSQATRQAIANDFRVPRHRIAVVPGGLDTTLFHNPGRRRRRPATLLFVGNTDDWRKGAAYLVRALALLPGTVRLRVVDDPYPTKKLLHEECKRLGVGHRVTFLGKLEHAGLQDEYCRCTMLVQPSLYEGFGLPAAEALACETPVVATAVGAVPEVVVPHTGLLVPPADPGALAGAIESLLEDPNQRRAMGQAGRRRMVRCFDWRIAGAKTAEVYQDVLTGRLPTPGRGGPGQPPSCVGDRP